MNPSTFNNTNFYVKTSTGASVTPATTNGIVYNAPTLTAVFTAASPLLTNTTYTVTLTTGIQNTSGTGLAANYTWSFTTGNASYVNPHGNYIVKTATCALCHQAHTAVGSYLLKQSSQTAVCFTCHNGTGSSYNEQAQFNPQSPMVKTSYHQVKNTGNTSYTGVLECTNCHNPHGNSNGPGTIYPRLLKSTDGTNFYYSGNAFCLACHGTLNQNFPGDPSYYADTGGDHTNPNAAHYNTSKSVLLPPSGTQITCVQCHDKHSGVNSDLLDTYGPALCFECHNNAANSMDNINIQADFSQTSYHDVFGNTPGDQLDCISCHGPHTVGAAKLSAGLSYSDISDPSNTKNSWTITSGGATNYAQAVTKFCLVCHGSTPPVAGISTTDIVPLTVQFASTNFTTNAAGWDKSSYLNSIHYQKGISCLDCHNAHGSPYLRLQARPLDSNNTSGECLFCHGGTTPAGYSFSTPPNVEPDLASTYSHPVFSTSGDHTDTEDYTSLISNGLRHADCMDCHDPHTVQAPSTTDQTADLGDVSGVKYPTTSWSNWSSATPQTVFLDPTTNNLQAYECYKCHSKFAGNLPTSPSSTNSSVYPAGSFQETDVAKEFNPANQARHVVEGTSQMPTYTYNGNTYYYGVFVNGWTATSTLKCTDCHTSSSSGVLGPHGSANPFMLKGTWTPNKVNGSSDLCFNCHDYNFYAGNNAGSATVRSAYSGSTSIGYNGHSFHAGQGVMTNFGCGACHGGLPHGWNHTDLNGGGLPMFGKSDPRPYSDATKMYDVQGETVNGTFYGANEPPGQWNGEHSGSSCGAAHDPNNGGSCT